MKIKTWMTLLFLTAAMAAMAVPGTVHAQGDETIAAAAVDAETFITVKGTLAGDVVSLYRIKDSRIVLVDTVVNTSNRGSSDTSFPKRYLIHLDMENR